MVLEMLDFSRLEAGKIKLARDEFSLTALVRSEFEKLEVPASAKRLRLSFDFPEDFTVIADEQRIAQVIENLASNAVKYTPEGGSVSVKLADEEMCIRDRSYTGTIPGSSINATCDNRKTDWTVDINDAARRTDGIVFTPAALIRCGHNTTTLTIDTSASYRVKLNTCLLYTSRCV